MKNKLIYPAAALVLLGCNDKESELVNKTDLLVGEWELKEVDGEPVDSEEGTYFMTFEFELDGDFIQCYEYDAYLQCYSGNWEWINANETIHMSVIDYNYFLDVTTLDADRLIGDYYEEEGKSEAYHMVFQKRN